MGLRAGAKDREKIQAVSAFLHRGKCEIAGGRTDIGTRLQKNFTNSHLSIEDFQTVQADSHCRECSKK